MSTRPIPDDDLYARLELTPDASPEAIEVAWRALLKRHHPDVAGNDAGALERAKRINVAHDWLGDPGLRARYDAERLEPPPEGPGPHGAGMRGGWGLRGGSGLRGRAGRGPRAGWTDRRPRPAPRPPRTDLHRGEPAARIAWFLDRVARLTPDELDRLAATETPPIAFHATIRRFVPPAAATAFAELAAQVEQRVPDGRWTELPVRDGLLGVAAELTLGPTLDELLDAGFRRRARERLLRAWEASVDQPRHGPGGAEVRRFLDRAARLTPDEAARLVRGSVGIPGDDRPWPPSLDPGEEEAIRVSADLAARDGAAAAAVEGLPMATATRVRRLVARLAHIVALRHAFAAREHASLVAPWMAATGIADELRSPKVRRAR